jgi:FkbM family methyltransferase
MNWVVELKKILSHNPLANRDIPINNDRIILYGAGKMGEMALDLMSTVDIKPRYIIDQKVRGFLRDIKVIAPEDIPKEDLNKMTVLVCIVTIPFNPIYQFLHSLGCKDVRHFYDFTEIVLKNTFQNGWKVYTLNNNDLNKIEKVCRALEHDNTSIAHYLQFLWWRLRAIEYIDNRYPVRSNEKYFNILDFVNVTKHESFLDGGAHTGETIKRFIQRVDGGFEHIWAFEPDKRNLTQLRQNIVNIPQNKISLYDSALSDSDGESMFIDNLDFASNIHADGAQCVKSIKIDTLEIAPTMIKLHLEGKEFSALKGAYNIIKKHRPILMVLADHNEDGLYKIANNLIDFSEYTLYFYLHDYCGNSAVFYAIPNERIK